MSGQLPPALTVSDLVDDDYDVASFCHPPHTFHMGNIPTAHDLSLDLALFVNVSSSSSSSARPPSPNIPPPLPHWRWNLAATQWCSALLHSVLAPRGSKPSYVNFAEQLPSRAALRRQFYSLLSLLSRVHFDPPSLTQILPLKRASLDHDHETHLAFALLVAQMLSHSHRSSVRPSAPSFPQGYPAARG